MKQSGEFKTDALYCREVISRKFLHNFSVFYKFFGQKLAKLGRTLIRFLERFLIIYSVIGCEFLNEEGRVRPHVFYCLNSFVFMKEGWF